MTPQQEKALKIRRTVHFSGRVQGVFFRATTEGIAADFSVTGYVRNLSDGRVEMVAEGETAELDRFQAAIGQAMRDNIQDVATADSDSTGEFARFSVRY